MNTFDQIADNFKWKIKQFILMLFLIFTFVTIASVCSAEEYIPDPKIWIEVASAKGSGDTFYLNIKDLARAKVEYKEAKGLGISYAKTYKIWELTIQKNKGYSKDLVEYDVNPQNRRVRTLNSINYDFNDNIIDSFDIPYPKWYSPTPETVGEGLYDFVDWWIKSN